MGLPGSGKTTLARELSLQLDTTFYDVQWINADQVRKMHNDWDFSKEGRIRQARRMRQLSDELGSTYVIADFVCPLQEMRDIYDPDWTIWMDTIDQGRYEDTNSLFEKPSSFHYDFRISEMDAKKWATKIAYTITNNIRYKFDM